MVHFDDPTDKRTDSSQISHSPAGDIAPDDVAGCWDEQGRLIIASDSELSTHLRSDMSVPVGGEQ